MIIVPLDRSFNQKIQPNPEGITAEVAAELQMRASAAGLIGTLVLAWEDSLGRLRFRAPTQWHPFFKSLSLEWVLSNVNRYLEW